VSAQAWCGVIIVAAGASSRMGGVDKQFAPLAGRPALAWAGAAFEGAPGVDAMVIVANPATVDRAQALGREAGWRKLVAVTPGGARRQDSAELGLAALEAAATAAGARIDLVMVHDGARPLVSEALIARGIQAGRAQRAAIAAVPARDTIKVVDLNRQIRATPARETVWVAQTPQVFRHDLLATAYRAAREQGLAVTDDAALLEALDLPVYVFEGETRNIKITTPEDLIIAEALLAAGPGADPD
jgi:2-C-methyl-D-erythritol 4-phosphate cytidylyltransferase